MITTGLARNIQRQRGSYIKFCGHKNLCKNSVTRVSGLFFNDGAYFLNHSSYCGRRYYCNKNEQTNSQRSGKKILELTLYAGVGIASVYGVHNFLIRNFITKGYDENDTISMTNFLGDSRISANKRRALATSIFEKPGSFNPRTLLDAAMFFMIEKDFEKSMVLLTGSINRCRMDLLFSNDLSLRGAPTILQNHMFELVAQLGLSQDELIQLQHESDKATENFDVWNSQHPFDYSETWLCSNGDQIKGEERDRMRQKWLENSREKS